MHWDFELISANNGWAMAVIGAIIVMVGLSALSFIISQLHKIIAIFDQKPSAKHSDDLGGHAMSASADVDLLNDLETTAKLYKAISADLGDSFHLSGLYEVIQRDQLPHPHLTIRSLREAGFLAPTGQGKFTWKNC